jgi:hypothetical protein
MLWVGRKRWFVELATTSSPFRGVRHIVDTATGEVTPVSLKKVHPSFDGRHFCDSGTDDYARRWNIYADDLTAPRAFTSPVPVRALFVLPGERRLVGWAYSELLFFDFDGTPLRTNHGVSVADACPSRDGKYVVTWTYAGVFRRWPVPD